MHASIFQFGLERVFLYCDNKRGQEEEEVDGWICGLSSNNRDGGGGDATLRHDVNNVKITQSENPREKRTAARNREDEDEDDEEEEEEEREMER